MQGCLLSAKDLWQTLLHKAWKSFALRPAVKNRLSPIVAGVSLLRVQTGCHKGACIYVFLENWQEILFGIYYSDFF